MTVELHYDIQHAYLVTGSLKEHKSLFVGINLLFYFFVFLILRKKEPIPCSSGIEDRFKLIRDFVESKFLHLLPNRPVAFFF